MRSLVALSVLFVAHALAKIEFGPCPKSLPDYTWNQYSANSGSSVYNHRMIFGDKTLDDFLGFGRSLIAQLPNFKCGDLYPAALYYPDQATWNKLFDGPKDGLYQKMLWFDPTSKTEVIYYCMDGARVPGLFKALQDMKIPIPAEVGQIISTVNQVVQTLNFLNLQIRFEGVTVTSDTRTISSSLKNQIESYVDNAPGYSIKDQVDYYTGCN